MSKWTRTSIALAVVGALTSVSGGQTVTISGSARRALPIDRCQSGLPSGTIWAAFESGPGRLRAYSNAGVLLFAVDHPAWIDSGSGRQVVIGPYGGVWVSDVGTQSVYQFGSDGAFLHAFPLSFPCGQGAGDGIRGMCFGPEESLFVLGGWQSGSINKLIEVEPATGTTLACYDLGFEAADISAGSDGVLYVTGYYGDVEKVDPDTGTSVGTVPTSACQATANLGEIRSLAGGRLIVSDANGGAIGASQLLVLDPSASSPCAGALTTPMAGGPWGVDVWGGEFYLGGQDMRIYVVDAVSRTTVMSFPTGQGAVPPKNPSAIVVVP